MDSGAVEEAHPASLERVLGTGRNHLAREAPGPRRVGHVPRGIDLLVVDRVDPGRRLEALLAHGDRVRVGELQVRPQPELEVAAVDCEVGGVLLGQLVGGDLRLHSLHRRLNGPVVRALDRAPKLAGQLVAHERHPVLARHRVERVGRRAHRRVRGRGVDIAGHLLDEVVERIGRVGDVRSDLAIDLAAGRIAPHPRGEGALVARP